MLNLDPRQRISAAQILKHPWITNIESLPDIKLTIQDGDNVKVCASFIYDCFVFGLLKTLKFGLKFKLNFRKWFNQFLVALKKKDYFVY